MSSLRDLSALSLRSSISRLLRPSRPLTHLLGQLVKARRKVLLQSLHLHVANQRAILQCDGVRMEEVLLALAGDGGVVAGVVHDERVFEVTFADDGGGPVRAPRG